MEEKRVEVIEFTDPVCTWCWGSEPILRALETRYKDQIHIKYVMGGLVEDIASFRSFNDIGGDPERSNRNIADHWLDASSQHKMPVEAEGFRLFSKENPSTYPQNIAYKAAQMQGEGKANLFLRRMREASAAEAKITSTTEVLLELASETGLDLTRFLEDLTNGRAEAAFKEDLAEVRENRVGGFPAFLIEYGDKRMMLRGYNSYQDFKTVITSISQGEIREVEIETDEESVLDFINTYRSAAPVEIMTAFDLTPDDFEKIQSSLMEKQEVAKREAGNGYFLVPKADPMACGSSGVCEV